MKGKKRFDFRALRARVSSLVRTLNADLLEREEAVRLCILCALAGESIFLLGPPGVAKSYIARRIKLLFSPDARAFEYLMHRFSTPDEIFGPISIASLKADRLERRTEAYLPGAVVVFLDEIWKAGPSIQNALLTAINERIFRNDGKDQKIPLRALISASNELPAEGEGLEALWDRFLVRLEVRNVEVAKNRHQLIRGTDREQLLIAKEDRFLDSDLLALDHEIDRVVIPDEILAIVDELVARIAKFNQDRAEAREQTQPIEEKAQSQRRPEIYVSDRRWKKIARLLRTSALCNGRLAVDEMDCYLIAYCIWDAEEQIPEVRRMVLDAIEKAIGPDGQSIENLRNEWAALKKKARSLPFKEYERPTPFQGHYKIDLSKQAELLTDEDGLSYPRVPIEAHKHLGEDFQAIGLGASGGGTKKAMVLAKRGNTPAEIVLKNSRNSPPLKAFTATAFLLTGGKRGAEESECVIDLADQAAQSFIGELSQFRQTLASQRGATKEISDEGDSTGHLFVEFPSDVADRLAESLKQRERRLHDLMKEVDEFARVKGLT